MEQSQRTHTPSPLSKQLQDGAFRDAKALTGLVRTWLAEHRGAIQDDFLKHQEPYRYLKQHTALIDELLQALWRYYGGEKAPLAIIATGGYGRGELFPYSDIDLMFLYEENDPAAASFTEAMLYVLWDTGLTVGHAYRSLDETIIRAQEDIGLRTNLLDARLIAGNDKIYSRFGERFNEEILSAPPLDFVEAKLAERDVRHKRFGDSRYMLEPNIKEGKGGLRDLHTIWWLARYVYPVSQFSDLVSQKHLLKEEYDMLDEARRFLYRVRIHLHMQAGHAEERLSFDRQHALAVAMGFSHPSSNKAIERFMRRYFVAVRIVGSMTRIFCALLEEEKKRKPKKPFTELLSNMGTDPDFFMDGDRLAVRDEALFKENPALMLALFHEAQKLGVDIHPKSLRAVAGNLQLIDNKLQADAGANALFMDILLYPKHAETTLRRMSEAGVLGRFIPDFGRAVGRTQFNRYHSYTVDEHTLVAVGNLHALENGLLKEQLPLASDAMPRIKMRRVLYLSVFCHDIAKGRGGDHSELGAKITERLARRFQFSADEIETAGWLVRSHLLFSQTAFKRDLDDPKTLEDFVAEVKKPERLRLLLALTVVDIRAVGPDVWNEWKASLMRDLFTRAEHAMGTGLYAGRQLLAEHLQATLARNFPKWEQQEIQEYIHLLPEGLISYCNELQHAAVARMVQEFLVSGKTLQLEVSHDRKHSVTEIIIATPDQKGLFSKLAGAMSLAGANIIGAKIFTLENGLAVDLFRIQNAAGEIFDQFDKLARMKFYMDQAVTGTMDIATAFKEHKKEFSFKKHGGQAGGQVFFENSASNDCTVIEVSTGDRIGLLYALTSTLAALDLTIATAHISTYGTEVSDVFYVKDNFGMKIMHDARLGQIRRALHEAINPQRGTVAS